jgi:hypothetical protein
MPGRMNALDRLLIGGGSIDDLGADCLRLSIPITSAGYADAQLDDYRSLRRSRFPHRPPIRLRLRARVSHPNPLGTLGFGFWNDPLGSMVGGGGASRALPASPQAVWFFYASPPSRLALSPDGPAVGWKAISMSGPRWLPGMLLPPAAAVLLASSYVPILRRWLFGLVLSLVEGEETGLSAGLDEWHEYHIDWRMDRAVFSVDGQEAAMALRPPSAGLGFVAWIDNQYAAFSPHGPIRFGNLPTGERQWLEICDLSLE